MDVGGRGSREGRGCSFVFVDGDEDKQNPKAGREQDMDNVESAVAAKLVLGS